MQHGEITETRDDIAAGRVWTVPAVCLQTAAGSRSAPILPGSIRGSGIGAGERSCWYRYDKRTALSPPRGASVLAAPCHVPIGACARACESPRSPPVAQHPARTSQRARDALTHQAPTRSIPRTSQHPSGIFKECRGSLHRAVDGAETPSKVTVRLHSSLFSEAYGSNFFMQRCYIERSEATPRSERSERPPLVLLVSVARVRLATLERAN